MGRPDLIRLGAIPAAATDVPLVVADTTRLPSALRWQPSVDLDAGLTKTIDWWRAQAQPASRLEAGREHAALFDRDSDVPARRPARRVPRERLRARLPEGRDRGRHHRQRRRADTRARRAALSSNRLTIHYLVNVRNRGYGFSVNRGIVESTRRRILLLNDDARPLPDLSEGVRRAPGERPARSAASAAARSSRATRTGAEGSASSRIDGEFVGNFDVDCGKPVEVEHVYGFCYVFTREAVRRAGLNDRTLLAQPYSSGNRIETDHCLVDSTRAGLRSSTTREWSRGIWPSRGRT